MQYVVFTLIIVLGLTIFWSGAGQSGGQMASPSFAPLSPIKQAILTQAPLIDVEYESPKMVVLKADEDTLLTTNGTIFSFWNAIDIVKQQGYTLEEVTTSGIGSAGNPTRFYAVMSRP